MEGPDMEAAKRESRHWRFRRCMEERYGRGNEGINRKERVNKRRRIDREGENGVVPGGRIHRVEAI